MVFESLKEAFICAVQLDPNHQEAWKDLGVLYEAKGQYHDAFICYRKSVDCRPGADDDNLINRSKILQDQEPPMINQTKLPSIEEAWTLPIPAELTQRQTVRRATKRNIHQELKKYKKMWSGHENNDTENDSTSSESNEPTISSNPYPNDSSSSAHPSWLPSQDEAKVLEHLQQSSHSLTPHQQSEMERLKFGQFAVEYHKRNQKSSRVPDPNNESNNMETVDFEPFSESTDYGMEVSAIRGRRTPGICSPTEFSHIVTANELIKTCQKLRQLLEQDTKLEIENKSSPYIPEITEKEVNCNPETPMVQIDNKKEASSKALSDLCCNNRIPAILIRGMCQVLRLDLGFFSTRSFSQVAGQNKVNVYTQKKDPSSRWSLDEKMSISTLRNYADYQASTFRDALKDDSKKEKRKNQKNPKNPKVAVKMSIFELSDEQFQINMGEIQKLPNFMKFYSVQNYLSYSDLPSNKLNVYFFIPNCKLKPKQHYFNKVSINVGPGDFEWFIVPEWHWAQVEEILLIHKKNLYDCWWPNLEIFQKYNIPIYRLVQKPGDILWIQSGSITWGHALGWCNSIMVS
jgi:histone demethylase